MSAKNCDDHNRWRNITVGFRVSPEENERLNRAVALSGLPKQEYCYRKCMDNGITVTPNPRIFKALKTALDDVWYRRRCLLHPALEWTPASEKDGNV